MKILEILCLAFLMISDCFGNQEICYTGRGLPKNEDERKLWGMALDVSSSHTAGEYIYKYHYGVDIVEYKNDMRKEINKLADEIKNDIYGLDDPEVVPPEKRIKFEKCLSDLRMSLESLADAISQFDLGDARYVLASERMEDVYKKEKLLSKEEDSLSRSGRNHCTTHMNIVWCVRGMFYYRQKDKVYRLMMYPGHKLILPLIRWGH